MNGSTLNMAKKVTGVILAAGMSSRMGETKQSLPFKGSTILGHVIKQAKLSKLEDIILVLGHDQNSIQDNIDGTEIKIVHNSNYREGQSTSLKAGINNISDSSKAAMFLLGDQPTIKHSTIDNLIYRFNSANAKIVIPTFNGTRGNPVIMSSSLFQDIKKLSGDTGGRAIFDTYRNDILKVPVQDHNILIDIDTREDYNNALATF